ncbi:MAG: glucose-6-phosphate dehydrogenase, partial [Terracidiphilus sp.]
MTKSPSDAFVFLGATGDLAYKQIFPALQGLIRDEGFNLPIIGVAKAGWTLDQLKARAQDSLEKHGNVDPSALAKLLGLLRYVDGDYNAPETFAQLDRELGEAQRPLHYLAIPPALFGPVASNLAKLPCSANARIVVEKPFGRNLESAKELSRTLHQFFPEENIFRIDHFLGKEPVQNILYMRFANPMFEPIWNRDHIRCIQI